MLRVAVPNKGMLAEPTFKMLQEAGYRQRRAQRELVLTDADNDTEFFFLRPRDIATYVGAGQVDAGITGRDLLLDGQQAGEEILALGFGGSTFRYAAVAGSITDVAGIAGKRIATAYSGLLATHLEKHGITQQQALAQPQ
jgi:ATP phosphoribosyltransferase